MGSQQPRPMATNNEQSNTTTNGDGFNSSGAGDGGGGSIPPVRSLARQQSFYSLVGDDYQRSPPQNNTTTTGNGLIGGGGGGRASTSRTDSLDRQDSIYSLSRDDYQRSLMEPGHGLTLGSMDIYEFMENIEGMACKQQQAQAHPHYQAQQQALEQYWQEDWLRVQQQQAQAQAQQAHLQANIFQQATARAQQARDQAQLFQGVGNRGPIPNIPNGGYMGLASSSAQPLGQMGMQSILAVPAPSPACEGGVNGHSNGLSLSPPIGTYGVDGSMGGRTRGADRPVDTAMERRLRRLISNRDSAERSRVRKQAHTVELETEIAKLKEENERLKIEKDQAAQLKEENWQRLRKEWEEMAKSLVSESTVSQLQSDGKMKLLRTRSAPF